MNSVAKTISMADFNKFFLGFDRFENVNHNTDTGYPRYNIVKTAKGYRVEIAVPGWNKSDIEISHLKDTLMVKGLCKQQTENKDESYVYKGLSGKEFTRTFTVGKHIQLNKAYMNKGLLCIDLDAIVPEEDRPRIITIE